MDDFERNLFERMVKAMEVSNIKMDEFKALSEHIDSNMKLFNDQFILHHENEIDITKEVKLIREELLKWLKWVAIALLISIGGGAIVEKAFNLIK